MLALIDYAGIMREMAGGVNGGIIPVIRRLRSSSNHLPAHPGAGRDPVIGQVSGRLVSQNCNPPENWIPFFNGMSGIKSMKLILGV